MPREQPEPGPGLRTARPACGALAWRAALLDALELRLGLFRIFDRQAALDVEPAHVGFAEVVVGLEAGGADAGDGAEIVDLVGVAGGGDGADHLAVLVADQLPAAL